MSESINKNSKKNFLSSPKRQQHLKEKIKGKRKYYLYELPSLGIQLAKTLIELEKQLKKQRKEKGLDTFPEIAVEIKK